MHCNHSFKCLPHVNISLFLQSFKANSSNSEKISKFSIQHWQISLDLDHVWKRLWEFRHQMTLGFFFLFCFTPCLYFSMSNTLRTLTHCSCSSMSAVWILLSILLKVYLRVIMTQVVGWTYIGIIRCWYSKRETGLFTRLQPMVADCTGHLTVTA